MKLRNWMVASRAIGCCLYLQRRPVERYKEQQGIHKFHLYQISIKVQKVLVLDKTAHLLGLLLNVYQNNSGFLSS